MAREFYQPRLNPVPFFKVTPDTNVQYNTVFFDDRDFPDTIRPYEQFVRYCIPWELTDSIRLQFISNFAPIQVKLVSEEGREYSLGNLQAKQAWANDPALRIYEGDFALNIFPEGHYRLRLDIGSPVTLSLQSPLLDIRADHPQTVLLDYRHYQYKSDVIFETGFAPVRRIYGLLRYKSPYRKDTLFEDQPLNQSLIQTRHARIWELQASSVWGIPDYDIDLLDQILGCSDVRIDGRYFTVGESKWEEASEEGYPMRGWKIELREKLNKASRHYIDETPQVGQIAVVINTDGKGFVEDDNGGSVYQILDTE